MKKKDMKDYSVDELLKQKKSTTVSLFVLAGLIVAYLIYFIWKLSSGTWEINNTLGMMVMGVLMILNANIAIQYAAISKELKSREKV